MAVRALLGSCAAIALLASACGGSPKVAAVPTGSPLSPSPLVAGGFDIAGGQSCLLTRRHRVECWGDNNLGQLGDGTMAGNGPVFAKGMEDVVAIAMNRNSACSLVRGGRVACWGFDTRSGFGDPESETPTSSYPAPAFVNGVSHASGVSTSGGNACAIVTGGRVTCWGPDNSDGTMGLRRDPEPPHHGIYPPKLVSGVKNAVRISYGYHHICALIRGGSVTCWGENRVGESGHGALPTNTRDVPVRPGPVPGISTAIAVSAGDASTCALLSDHTVRCWGDNYFGALGNGRLTGPDDTHESPVVVKGVSGATAISVGGDFACAIVSGGHVWCWGYNGTGQLGDGFMGDDNPSPAAVHGISHAVAIAAGGSHTCALLARGTVECWGADNYGQLGDGKRTVSATPVTVRGVRY